MYEIDTSTSATIPQMLDLLSRVSRETDPVNVQRIFGQDMRDTGSGDAYLGVSVRGLPEGEYKLTRRWVRDVHEVEDETVNPWRDWAVMPSYSGGFVGRVIQRDRPQIFHQIDLSSDPALSGMYSEMRSCMATPIFDEGEAKNWSFTFRRDPQGFSVDDMEKWLLHTNLVGRMIKNLVTAQQVQELNRKLVGQLEEIARLQQSLLPAHLPEIDGVSIAASYLTSNEAGGDYYDFFEMGDGRWAALIADVSGHGAGAATVMAMLHTIFHDFQEREQGPAAMLAHANRRLRDRLVEGNFVTAFLGVIDPEHGQLLYANAGHNRPIHRIADGRVGEINGDVGLPLGVLDDLVFERNVLPIDQGDTIVLYTDGITEAFSPPPEREMFGTGRLADALLTCTGEPPCVVDSIHERLFAHTRSLTRTDDQTIVAIRLDGGTR